MSKTILVKVLLIVFSLVIGISCRSILLKKMFKNPIVETTSTIKEFQTINKYSTENSLIKKGDTLSAVANLFLGMSVGYYIFDRDGNLICYNGYSTCKGVQFKELLANKIDSFKRCTNELVNLDDILKQAYDLNEKEVNRSQFGNPDYYIVSYWQKFLGGKKGYEDAITWMEDEIMNNKTTLRFEFIKINTDLQEKWGLVAGGKAKLEIQRKSGRMNIVITDLPIKR